jgi:hypothetical protein
MLTSAARTVPAAKGCLMEITNLGKANGLPPVDWAAIAEKLDAGSAPAAGAANSRTTWLSTMNEDGSPRAEASSPGTGRRYLVAVRGSAGQIQE